MGEEKTPAKQNFFGALLKRFRARLTEETRDEDFSPATLEVLDSPPAPFARFMVVFILVFVLFVVSWSVLAKMDIVVSGAGTVIPKGRVKVVQPLEPGIVTAIHVRDGQVVKKGEVLISMDSTDIKADINTTREDLAKTKMDILRFKAELEGNMEGFSFDPGSDGEKAMLHSRLLASSIFSHEEQMAAYAKEIESLTAEKKTAEAEQRRYEKELPLARTLYRKKKKLAEKKLVPEAELLQERINLNNAKQNLIAARSKLQEVEGRLNKAIKESSYAQTEYQRDLLNKISEAENKKKSLEQQLEKAKNRQMHYELKAPAAGIVQQLAVNNVDSVVTAAQTLMVIVPLDGGLEVEAKILNKDIGFVKENQEVSVKVAAYPFTRYGDLIGHIEWVAKDAVMDEMLGPVYPARVAIPTYVLPNVVNGRRGIIAPGMTVTADIKVGKRGVFQYFLEPIMRYKNKSLREM